MVYYGGNRGRTSTNSSTSNDSSGGTPGNGYSNSSTSNCNLSGTSIIILGVISSSELAIRITPKVTKTLPGRISVYDGIAVSIGIRVMTIRNFVIALASFPAECGKDTAGKLSTMKPYSATVE